MVFLVLIFIVVPIVELWLIIEVGQLIGVWPTIALLIADSFLGAFLLRSQGRQVWQRFTTAVAQRRIPHREIADGVMIILGGALLLTPGFLTDIFGLILLIPPTRAIVRKLFLKFSLAKGTSRFFVFFAPTGARPNQSYDVDSTATDLNDKPPSRPQLNS